MHHEIERLSLVNMLLTCSRLNHNFLLADFAKRFERVTLFFGKEVKVLNRSATKKNALPCFSIVSFIQFENVLQIRIAVCEFAFGKVFHKVVGVERLDRR